MRILLSSVPFRPSVGGIETVTELLAAQFVDLGHEVAVVTRTDGTDAPGPYPVVRRPGARRLRLLVRAADVVLHNGISLRLGWPLGLPGHWRPWLVAHHIWLPRRGAGVMAAHAKRLAMRAARNVAVSRALAASLPCPAEVIPNPYDERVFRRAAATPAAGDLVYVGRLVADKGVHVLLDALVALRSRGDAPRLTIVGDGPEGGALRERVLAEGLGAQVRFAGVLRGTALADLLGAHTLLVVPSVWEEPFGVVALEGIACGLVPVATDGGGLPEAVGPCGVVVPRGDAPALARALADLLGDPGRRARLRTFAPAHLDAHAPRTIAQRYLAVLADAAGR